MKPEQAVLNYKKLAEVERAFRSLKGVEPGSVAGPSLHVRPIGARLGAATFTLTPRPNDKQSQLLDLIDGITV